MFALYISCKGFTYLATGGIPKGKRKLGENSILSWLKGKRHIVAAGLTELLTYGSIQCSEMQNSVYKINDQEKSLLILTL